MRIIFPILSSFLILSGCSSLQNLAERFDRSISRDGLSSRERAEKYEQDEIKRQADIEAAKAQAEAAMDACWKKATAEKLSDLKKSERCFSGYRKGLAKNNAATYYLWFDGYQPVYLYYDKAGKFILEEIDQDTINARTIEENRQAEVAETHRLMRIQNYNTFMTIQNQRYQNQR